MRIFYGQKERALVTQLMCNSYRGLTGRSCAFSIRRFFGIVSSRCASFSWIRARRVAVVAGILLGALCFPGLDLLGPAGVVSANEQAAKRPNYTRTSVAYQVPDIDLFSHDGKAISLVSEITGDKPVMVNFIFTSCTTICPVLSASFAEVSRRLAEKGDQVEFISISIDPEYDTQPKLAEYAERMGAGDSWRFLTGDPDDVLKVEKAFKTYRGNKMNHLPLTFIKPAGAKEWIRLEGFPSVDEILMEYRSAGTS